MHVATLDQRESAQRGTEGTINSWMGLSLETSNTIGMPGSAQTWQLSRRKVELAAGLLLPRRVAHSLGFLGPEPPQPEAANSEGPKGYRSGQLQAGHSKDGAILFFFAAVASVAFLGEGGGD